MFVIAIATYKCRSPLLGVCILRTTAYWGCESIFFRGSVEFRGIQCTLCPYKEDARFVPAWEIGNVETIWRRRIYHRRHLLRGQPMTLTMTFPLRILLKMKTKIYTLKLPVIIHHQSQKACNAKTKLRRSSMMLKTKPKQINWIKLSSRRTDQIAENSQFTRNGSLVVFVKAKKQRTLNKN